MCWPVAPYLAWVMESIMRYFYRLLGLQMPTLESIGEKLWLFVSEPAIVLEACYISSHIGFRVILGSFFLLQAPALIAKGSNEALALADALLRYEHFLKSI